MRGSEQQHNSTEDDSFNPQGFQRRVSYVCAATAPKFGLLFTSRRDNRASGSYTLASLGRIDAK
jgi:hypothetical protein